MVSLAEKRAAVAFLRQDFELSQRRACRLVGQSRSSERYAPRRAQIAGLRERLIELAHQRTRFGYPRLHMLLRRFAVNRKRVWRLYREAGLKLRPKRKKRVAMRRGHLGLPQAPNDR
jgi:putative transposase